MRNKVNQIYNWILNNALNDFENLKKSGKMINIIFKYRSYRIKPLCIVFNYYIPICEMFEAYLRNTM